jgi:hypothetical protein
LEQLVKHLGDELASFRRRALQAEARIKNLESTGVKGVVSPERVQFLAAYDHGPPFVGAEARIKNLESTGVKRVVSPECVQFLEKENAGLTSRLDAARARTQQMIDRVRFLRQQHDGAGAR